MKRGMEYAVSQEKRALDLVVANVLSPVRSVTELGVRWAILHSTGRRLSPIFEQERVGRGFAEFTIEKFRTYDPQTAKTFGNWADEMRRLGVDEWAQVANIKRGEMSAAGHRPIIAPEYEELRDNEDVPARLRQRWDLTVVGNTNPGAVSSYAIYHHTHPELDPNEGEIRMEMDLQDVIDGSLAYDIRLISQFAVAGLSRRLR